MFTDYTRRVHRMTTKLSCNSLRPAQVCKLITSIECDFLAYSNRIVAFDTNSRFFSFGFGFKIVASEFSQNAHQIEMVR